MSITVTWDNDDRTTIRYDFAGRWTWEEFYAATQEAFALTRSVEHRVDTITNFLPDTTLPPSALMHFRRAMVNAPKNRGLNVITGGPIFIRTMVRMFSKINRSLGERLLLADNVEHARALIVERQKQREQI